MKLKLLFFMLVLSFCNGISAYAQQSTVKHIEKRYNIFFRINDHNIDSTFKENARAIQQMRSDIRVTLDIDGAVPDSLLILSTASPDGSILFNRALAKRRAESTRRLILGMFPEFEDADIKVEFLDEDWDGLLQVLKVHKDFPQRDEMMAVIYDDSDLTSKEWRLRALKKGWRYLVDNYIYALRNSSITMSVVMTASNSADEFVRQILPQVDSLSFSYKPHFPQPFNTDPIPQQKQTKTWYKTFLAARSNLLIPGMNVGIEIPIRENWSVGLDYYYPWFVSAGNKWCVEMLGWFVDAKYWFTNDKTRWLPDSRLKGHGVGIYAGLGYYDFQNATKGSQGEYVNFGVDYTYSLPVANDKLRLEFNLGLGILKTWYRPYTPSSDYADLIKEPGVKYRSTNFVCPTMAGVSLVWPITVPVKNNPYLKILEREQRKAKKKNDKAGGDK